nr:MAG TPA: hypothetical protein [Caudoviricetes sp.]
MFSLGLACFALGFSCCAAFIQIIRWWHAR